MDIGQKLKALRKNKGLTLDKLAEMTGVAKATLSRIENGIVGGNYKTFRKISETLGISIEELGASPKEKAASETSNKNQIDLAILKVEIKDIAQRLLQLCDKISIKIDGVS